MEDRGSINGKIAALGINRSVVSDRYGVSRSAFYTNIKRYDEGRYDEIAPGLLSFFRFVDEKAQTKNDVQKFLSGGPESSEPQNASFNIVSGRQTVNTSNDTDTTILNPVDLFNRELCVRLLHSSNKALKAVEKNLEEFPDLVTRGDNGEYDLHFEPMKLKDDLRGKLMAALAVSLIIEELSKDPSLSDLGLTNLIKAKEYINKTASDLFYILDDGHVTDDNIYRSRISASNHDSDIDELPKENWYVVALLYDVEESSGVTGTNMFATEMCIPENQDPDQVVNLLIEEHSIPGQVRYHIFGPYDLRSTAENVKRYLVNDWRVTMSPTGRLVDQEDADNWLIEKKVNKALRRGLN